MSSAPYVRVVNQTDQRLPFSVQGVDIIWEPRNQKGSVLELPKDAADICKAHFGELLLIIEPKKLDFTDPEKSREYFLANMTGDPDAWEKRPVKQYNYGLKKYEVVDIINENKDPAVFTATLGRYNGFVDHWVTYIDGEMQRNVKPTLVTIPGRPIEIPPYSRAKVTAEQLQVLMARDADSGVASQGRIIISRAYGYEPDLEDTDYWTHDRIRVWLGFMPALGGYKAGKDIIGKSEAELRADLKAAGASDLAYKMALYTARKELCFRAHFRAANPIFILPKREAVDSAYDKLQKSK